MKAPGLLALALVGVVVALLVFGIVGQTLDGYREPSYAERVAEQVRAERLQQQAELDAAWAPVERVAGAVLLYGALLAVLLYVGALGALHVRRAALERTPNSMGVLPLLASDQQTARAALASFHMTRLEDARRPVVPQVPHALTFAPHYSHRQDAAQLLPGDVATVAQLAPPVPSFSALLDAGRVGKGNPMLLGFDAATAAPVEGSWLDLYSCGLGGLSGSGKSWTATYLAAQAALFGTKIVLLDPHAGNDESLAMRLGPLAGRFVCAPAESPREMLAAVNLVAEELRRRKAGARGEPMLFIADEYSALQRGELAEPLGALVEALGQEGRKLGLFALVAGQIWTASRAGGSEVRDSLASAYVHRCRPAQARYLTGMTAADLPSDLLELPSGTAYLLDTSGDFRRVTIPHMAAGDVARVAQLLNAQVAPASSPPTVAPPFGFRPVGTSVGATVGAAQAPLRPHQDAAQLSPEEAGIVAGFLAGKSPSDLAAELAGGMKAGDAYARAARKVAEALRRALARG